MKAKENIKQLQQRIGATPDGIIGKNTMKQLRLYTGWSPYTVAAFMANLHHESGVFSATEENLKYSAERLMQVWPSRFKTSTEAKKFANNPKKLANFIYGRRMGNSHQDDGWLFRGRGFLQLTGRENYEKFFRSIGKPLEPDLVATVYALDSAIWFFNSKDLADQPFFRICRKINGGDNGMDERKKLFEHYLTLL